MRVRAVNGPEKEKPIGTKGPTSTPSDTHTPTGVGGVGGGEKAVSYTHLTLPTKLSV